MNAVCLEFNIAPIQVKFMKKEHTWWPRAARFQGKGWPEAASCFINFDIFYSFASI